MLVPNIYPVVVASPAGLIKGLTPGEQAISSLFTLKGHDVSSLCWRDEAQNSIFIGTALGRVCLLDMDSNHCQVFVDESQTNRTSRVITLSSDSNSIFVAQSCGYLGIHDIQDGNTKLHINGPDSLCTAKLFNNHVAAGGNKSNLRIWDINNSKEAIFVAKNPRSTTLELPVPIWISDVCFIPGSNGNLIVTASRYGELDLYDLRSGQRRPVARHAWRMSRKHGNVRVGSKSHSAIIPDLNTTRPITKVLAHCHSPGQGIRVVAGNAVGELCFLDLRLPKECVVSLDPDSGEKSTIPVKSIGSRAPEPPSNVHSLAGASGSISGLICGGADEANSPVATVQSRFNDQPILVATSLDRFVRIYNRDSGKRIAKIYAKVPISSFLVTDEADLFAFEKSKQPDQDSNPSAPDLKKHQESTAAREEFESLWNQLPKVDEDPSESNPSSKDDCPTKPKKRK